MNTETLHTDTVKTTYSNMLSIDYRNIVVIPGSNSRVDYGNIEELADSLVRNGQKNPCRVKKLRGEEKYILIDGFRRFKAIELANKDSIVIPKVKALSVPVDYTEEQKVMDQILCNDGKPLNNYEFGLVCVKLMKFGWNMSRIAKSVSRTKAHIENCIALTKLDEEVTDYIVRDEISTHTITRILQATEDESERMTLIRRAVAVGRRTNRKATFRSVGVADPTRTTIKRLERVLMILDEKHVDNDKKELLANLLVSLKDHTDEEIIADLFV